MHGRGAELADSSRGGSLVARKVQSGPYFQKRMYDNNDEDVNEDDSDENNDGKERRGKTETEIYDHVAATEMAVSAMRQRGASRRRTTDKSACPLVGETGEVEGVRPHRRETM